ncbi:Tms1p Ecym_3506 [Eremothecium cymbalariae DBVPG|uniref:Membrane protein TMS1 n=1 Tax=Eremothecium cymbalariae (strain CBS 270.75 / DBVPG 7215 / KCTC 17166 / NRRL Y-17582) TaxID=931890 RepID=G8JS65_ERECY|nr:Hypothetical protein Ecym_3506 [Eremothecium cymbalariae DBVPG\
MGALVSLPINVGVTFVSSCLGSCCSSAMNKTFSSISNANSSFATRMLYAVWLLFNSLISWIAMSSNHSLLWPGKTCTESGECGFFTVHRLNFSLGIMHLILAAALINVKSTRDPRAKMQNSWWWLKVIIYLLFIILSFTIPNEFYIFFSKWVSLPSGTLFILTGLVLLVDFAHEWAETCIQHVELEDEDSGFWQKFLIIGTAFMYASALAMNITMFVLFCRDKCKINNVALAINIILHIITSVASVHPSVQEYNPKCGFAQSAMVGVYCTYLTMSAMASEPDDKQCNPLIRSSGTRKASVILGSIFTFVAIAYTTTRAAANSAFQIESNRALYLAGDDIMEYEGITQSRHQLRQEAVRKAVQEGSLPESVLSDNQWTETDIDSETGDAYIDDEKYSTKYNYSLFHIIFFLATQWIAILLTININQDDMDDFIPVGRTYFYSWVKIISAWICYVLYGWSLIAPMVMPERFENEFY